ncbi:TolC family protein [Arundinibacter roseus]|nr:TolC family protein [Arundinibacter roseus]
MIYLIQYLVKFFLIRPGLPMLAGSLILTVLPAVAQQSIGLKECVELLTKNNLTYREGMLQAEAAHANWRQARSQQLPQMSLDVGQSVNLGRSIDRFTNAYIDQLYNSNYVGAGVQVPIFQGFRMQHQIRQNQLLKEASLENTSAVLNLQILNMMQAYVQVLASQALHKAAQQQVASSKEQVHRVQKQVDAGVVGGNALYDIKAQLSIDTFDEVTALNTYRMARLALFQLLNISPNDTLELQPLDVPKNVSGAAMDAETMYTEAQRLFPDIRGAELSRQSFAYQAKAIRALNLPSLNVATSLGAFYASTNANLDYFKQLNATRNGSLSLGLSIPILGRWQTGPRVESVKVQERLAQNQLDVSKLQLRQAIEQCVLDVTASAERYQVASEQFEALSASYALVESRLNAGTATLFEYSLSKANLARAQANAIRSGYEYVMNQKKLRYYQQGNWNGIL